MFPVKVYYLILLICFAGMVPGFLYAQDLNFIHYNTNNSALPHNICYELMQDKTGYLWAGTDNGLVRFDGRDMKIYRQCFRSPFATVAAEYDSTFLIATWIGGIYKLAHDSIKQVYSNNPGWVASGNNLLLYRDVVLLYHFNSPDYFRFNKSRDTLVHAHFFIEDTGRLLPLIQDYDTPAMGLKYCVLGDRLIAYGDKGIFCLEDSVFRKLSARQFDHLLQSRTDGKIYGYHAGCIYILSGDLRSAACVYDLRKISGAAGLRASGFILLSSGNLVLKLAHRIYEKSPAVRQVYINAQTLQVTDLEQMLGIDVFISDMIADHENGFWVGTDGNGLYHVLESGYRQYGNKNEFANPFVTAMMQYAPQHVYIGTKNGVYLLDGNRLKLLCPGVYVHRFFRYGDSNIRAQLYHDNNLLLTGDKVVKLATNTFRIVTRHYVITEMQPDIRITDRHTGAYLECIRRNVPLISRAIHEDNTGCVWHGTDFGLYWWHPGDTAATPYPNALLGTALVHKLVPDSLGGLWVVTAGAGLFYLRNEKIVAAYNEKNGLSNTSVTALLLHAGKVWIGTPNGLNVLDSRTGHIAVYKKYDGLIASDVTALAPFSDSEIVVSSSKGITVFHNNEQKVPRPQLTLEQVMVDGRIVNARAPVTGNYKSRISLTYNVVSFIYPELVRFQYRLSDNDAWIETADKSIVLTNLEPGTYRLQVRACKYHSGWSSPFVLALEIRKPWWRTNVFYIITASCIVLCIYFLLRRRSVTMNEKLLQRQQFAELKLKALQAQLNPHFISNALSAIQYFTLIRDETSANEYLSRFAGLTRLLLESSCSRFVTLKDELQIVRYYFDLEKLRFRNRFVYDIYLSPEIDAENEWLPGVLLQPFVENSINHGIVYLPKDVQGHIQVHIRRQDEILLIEITDNGIGRSKAREIQQYNGRAHKSRSAEIMGGISQSVNGLEGCYMQISVTDLMDEHGNAAGTKIHISCVIANQYKPHYANSNY